MDRLCRLLSRVQRSNSRGHGVKVRGESLTVVYEARVVGPRSDLPGELVETETKQHFKGYLYRQMK